MTAITAAANDALRDFATAGVPASGEHEPVKSEVRAVFSVIDTALSSLGVNGAIAVKKATKALLDADLAHAEDVLAVVYNDETAANNGIYAKVGASASGSWSLTDLALPASFADDIAEVLSRMEEVDAAVTAAEGYRDEAEAFRDEIEDMATAGPDAVSVIAKLNKVSTLADLASQTTGVTYAWVAEVKAYYKWELASELTGDSWGVIDPAAPGAGRWVIYSGVLTVPALGTSGDNARIQAALASMAALGKRVRLEASHYGPMGQISFPATAPVRLDILPGAELEFNLDPESGSPANAGLYCAPGAADRTSTVAAINTVSNYTLTIEDSVSAGEMIRVLDTATGGFRGNRYMVQSVTPSGDDFIVTVDRPVLTQFSVGDAVAIWTSKRAFGHRIYGAGAKVTGTGTRMYEFIGTEDCQADGLLFEPDDCQSVASFDTFGFNNHFVDCTAVAGSSGANNGFLLETQEASSAKVRASGFLTDGVRLLNDESCRVDADCWGNYAGVSVGGEANFLGCNNTQIRGRYNANTAIGVSVTVGSRNTDIDAEARFNPTNVVVGDGAGGNVTRTTLRGDFSSATNIGITIFSSAIGTQTELIDVTGCAIGVNAQGNAVIEHLLCYGAPATNVLLNTGAQVRIKHAEINITSTIFVIKTTGTGKTVVDGGNIAAGSASEIFQTTDTATVEIGAVNCTAAGASYGINAASGTTARFTELTNFAGVASEYNGAGTIIPPRRMLSRSIASVGTTAVTTEETLKTYSIAANTAKAGMRYTFRFWGTLANNANVKTIRVRFGSTAIVAQTMPTSTNSAWEIEFTVWITGSNTQELLCTMKTSAATTPASQNQTKTDTSAIAVDLTAQNGTAAANDIVCRGMEVLQMAA